MKDKDYELIRRITIEVLTNDYRPNRVTKESRARFERLADEVIYNIKLFDRPKASANSNAPLPGQIDLFTGAVVGEVAPAAHPEPKWVGGLCPTCGGSKFVVAGDGRMRANCPTCHGTGDRDAWEKQKAEREKVTA
jgi:hypothetical protein